MPLIALDSESGRVVFKYNSSFGRVRSVAWSPNARLLASGGSDQTVRLWDAPTGQPRRTIQEHSQSVNSVAWNPDGQLLASSSVENTIKVWNSTSGFVTGAFEGHSETVAALNWSRDGRLASGSTDKQVLLDDVPPLVT